MPSYDPKEQWKIADKKVLSKLIDAWEDYEPKPPMKALEALVAAAIVESNIKNVKHGDLDSLGVLQQRGGWGSKTARMDPKRAATAFLKDLMNRVWPNYYKLAPGDLAQKVQRSAAKYADRYTQAMPAARYIIKMATTPTAPAPICRECPIHCEDS